MLKLEEKKILENNCRELIDAIEMALINKFDKTNSEAKEIIKQANIFEYLMENPVGLHDSPEKWALIILTELEDLDSIDKFYKK